ncbi:MAG: SDR family oxidoreductase [Alphaproteobacteria bacterium]|nr:SDR family oxidoreductase [Alphaproteobacteria bacterium]
MTDMLKGKIAIVTGSDSGIGQATAVAFAEEGADVTVTYFRDRGGADHTRTMIEATGRRAIVVRLDQRQPGEVERLFRDTEEKLGLPDILVNNAALNSTGTQVADMPIEDWDDVLRTNLYGPFLCCRRFIQMRRRAGGRGKIINVTSIHQDIPRAGSAGYDASKGGLRNLTRTLCLELAPDRINVNNIAPGMVLTAFNQRAIDDARAREEQVQNIPWKRAAEPREIARLAVYLASEDADYVSGQTFTIDGGLSMTLGQGA